MSPVRFLTNPLLFGHARVAEATVTSPVAHERFRAVSERAWALAYACLDGATEEELATVGFTGAEIDEALAIELLLDADSPASATRRIWEDHHWYRASLLLATQLDLPYLEEERVTLSSLVELSDHRRRHIESYLTERPYPETHPFQGDPVQLPNADGNPPIGLLDALYHRRSIRSFAATPPTIEVVGAILWAATKNIRTAEASKAPGDPYYLLNSFYAWLDIHLIAQEIEGLERGVYRYDPLAHRLHCTRIGVSDEEILDTVARQRWALGTGAAIYIAAQWERYRWLYRHSRAYLNLLIQVGEFAQEVIHAMYRWRLGGWVTPAVGESAAARLLDLPDGVDALLFVKFGVPAG